MVIEVCQINRGKNSSINDVGTIGFLYHKRIPGSSLSPLIYKNKL
jgi:hypothetical protein